MSELMKKCDIAISACGSTIYELCAMNVPSIGIIIADYYEKTYVLEAFKNVCKYLSSKYKKDYDEVYKRCAEILDEHDRGKIFIGDNPNKDFIAAKNLGMKTIRIIHKQGNHINDEVDMEYEAELIIRKLSDILTLWVPLRPIQL